MFGKKKIILIYTLSISALKNEQAWAVLGTRDGEGPIRRMGK